MSLSSYNIRFMLSVQNNTRNSLNRVMADMRKMSKVERELAASQKHLNMAQREASKESALLQKRQTAAELSYRRMRRELSSTAKAWTRQSDGVRRYKDQLKALESRQQRLLASQRNASLAMRKHAVGSAKWLSAQNLHQAATIDLRRLPAQAKQLQLNIRRANTEMARLKDLQMQQLAGLKLNKKEQREILALMRQQAAAEAELAAQEERLAAKQRRRDVMGNRIMRGRMHMDIGRNMQLRGLLLTAGLGYAADYASKFATSTAKAASQVQAPGGGTPTVKQIAANDVRLQKDILNLMGQYPAKAQEMTDASYQIFSSMNVNYTQGINLLKTFNAIAVAGATDLATATNAGITLFNNFGGSAAKNARVLDTAFAIIRVGRMEFEDFNQMLNQVAPAAKAAGQSLVDVGGAMAFLTTRMPSQRMAATALARLMEGFSRSDFRAGMQKLGKSIEDDMHNLLPLPQIMEKVASLPMAQSRSGLNNLFPFVTKIGRGRGKFGEGGGRGIEFTKQGRTALTLMATDMKAYLALQKQVNQAQDEFAARYATMLGTPGVKWEKFKSQLQAIAIEFGTYLIPYMMKFAYYLNEGIKWARSHQDLIKWVAIGMGAFAMLNLLGGAIVTVAGAVQILYAGLAFLVGESALGGLAGAGMKGALIGLGKFTGLTLAAVGAVYSLKGAIDSLNPSGGDVKYDDSKWGFGLIQRVNRFTVGSLAGIIGSVSPSTQKKIMDIMNKQDKWNPFGNLQKGGNKQKQKQNWKKSVDEQVAEAIKAIKAAGNAGYNKKVMAEYMKAAGVDPAAIERWRASDSRDPAKQLATNIRKNVRSIQQEVRTALESLYNELKQTNETMMGDLFQGRWLNSDKFKYFEQFGIGPTLKDMNKDVRTQIKDFKLSQKVFAKLKKMGLSDSVIKDLRDMGPEGYKYIKAILKGSKKDLREFVALMNQRKKTITNATNADFKARVASWQQHGKSLAEGLATGFDLQKDTMYSVITNAITHAFSGAIQKMAEVQAIAEQTSNAIYNVPVPGGGVPTGPTKGQTKFWQNYRANVIRNYPMNSGGAYPYGNPGVWGRGVVNIPSQGAVNAPDNRTRNLSNTNHTEVYNITGFSPDDALKALETKRAFRMKNRRR